MPSTNTQPSTNTLPHPTEPAAAAFALALQRALQEGRGKVVLRVEEVAPYRRRAARSLMQEGALAAGGRVMDGPAGELLLVGAEAGLAGRLRGLLDKLVGPAATQILSLERDAAALRAYAAGTAALPAGPAPEGPGLAGLDAALDAMPLGRAVRRLHGMAPGGARPAFLRIEPDRAWLARALGVVGGDADLLDHAARRMTARLLAALADPAEARKLLGPAAPPRLHLPLPAGGRAAATATVAPPGLLVATLTLAEAADPAALAARRAGLAAAGIGIEIEGLDAAALGLLESAALPGDLVRLAWSPALEEGWARAALDRLGPARVVLAGATEAEAARLGVGLFEAAAP
jgi:hypothetical protein